MILIVGASGKLGGAVARWALGAGKPVLALSRKPEERLAVLKAEGAEVMAGDLRDRASLERACQGATHVVASAHSILGKGEERSALVDDQGHRDLIDAAKKAGVQHFIYISAWGAGPDHPAAFFRYKYGVEEYLKASGLPFTIIQPTFFLETHAYEMRGKTILEQGKVNLFGKGEGRNNYVLVGDIARLIALIWDDPKALGQTIEIGGPPENNLSDDEVVALFEDVAGKKAKVSRVPRVMLQLMSPLMKPINPGMSQVMAMALYADTHDQSFDAGPLLRSYPLELTRLTDWINDRFVPTG